MNNKKNIKIYLLVALIIVGFASKIFLTSLNFSPIGAMILLGAAYFTRTKYALLLPLLLMWIVDLYLNNVVYTEFFNAFQVIGQPGVYISLILIVLVGRKMLKNVNILNVVGASLMASVLFFVITNFNSWIANPAYPQNFMGLMESYTAGIPFFRGTLMSNLLFTSVLFFAFERFDVKYFTSILQNKGVQNIG